jgi:excisionase family DNA binding protein
MSDSGIHFGCQQGTIRDILIVPPVKKKNDAVESRQYLLGQNRGVLRLCVLMRTMELFFDDRLAEYLTVSKQWIYERSHLKEIPHIKKQGLLRFRKREIDKWLD